MTGRRFLLVGGGSVAQVLALHLGTASVEVLAREGRRERLAEGVVLQRLGRGGGKHHLTLVPPSGLRGPWDAVFLTVPSTALEPTWLASLARATGNAPVVMVQPGLYDADLVTAAFGAARIVRGQIGFVACPSGALGSGDGGTAFWLPPGSRCRFSGPGATFVADVLNRGGLPAVAVKDVRPALWLGGALLDTQVAGLACAGWSLRALRADRGLRALSAAAAREAVIGVSRELGAAAGIARVPLGGWPLLAGWLGKMLPFDLEAFLRGHFGKLGDQTRGSLAGFAHVSERHGLEPRALRALLARQGADVRREVLTRRHPRALRPSTARKLAERAPVGVDQRSRFAIKRNEHELVVSTGAGALARALESVLSRPGACFGGVRVARAADRLALPFSVGERFQGCLSLGTRASGPGSRIEEQFLSDFAELMDIQRDPEGGRFRFEYGYLSGNPMAGRSVYEIEPLGPSRCRVRVRFEFQERGLMALAVLHGFGLRAHDRAVAEQIREAAEAADAAVTSSSIRL